MTRRQAGLALAALAAAAVVLVVVELALGAIHFGETRIADPCTAKPELHESGIGGAIDAEVQRFALAGLNGAACTLRTTPEELVLSFVPAAGTKTIRWDRKTIEDALHAGFDKAFDEVESQGIAGLVIGRILRTIVGDPLEYLLGRALPAEG